ncbi:MAG: class I SAM-dependent methyltransferase [Verrucomicrobia bacterium]|nr:class I SAM-dependent methyltransferase [Verrucomicrobiota bacterium]
MVNAFYRWRRPLDVSALARDLESKGFQKIRDRYADPENKKGWPKYVDAENRLELAIRQARALELDRRRSLQILDIGSGAGYFLYICKLLGHQAIGLDLDWPPMYFETFKLFGLQRIIWRIEAFQSLPALQRKFDIVTSFAICFNNHGSQSVWGRNEWQFFLDDVIAHYLQPKGTIYLELNPEPWGYHTPELQDFFLERGARVAGKQIWLTPCSSHGPHRTFGSHGSGKDK